VCAGLGAASRTHLVVVAAGALWLDLRVGRHRDRLWRGSPGGATTNEWSNPAITPYHKLFAVTTRFPDLSRSEKVPTSSLSFPFHLACVVSRTAHHDFGLLSLVIGDTPWLQVWVRSAWHSVEETYTEPTATSQLNQVRKDMCS
jgi:hypothetical protein